MTDQYPNNAHVLVALDCIIFGFDENEVKLLLIKRDFAPEKEKWSLMGGFMERDENLDAAAERILHKLTGLKKVFMEQLLVFGDTERDPAERTVSVAYYALINIRDHNKELVKKFGAEWFPISKIPQLIFDHNHMVDSAKIRLRYKASHQPIGFELLPSKFTMPELQKLYEAIYESPMDTRNFSKKLLSMGILVKLQEKQKGHSRKGAFYYRFDQSKYQKSIINGLSYNLAVKGPGTL